MAKAKFENREAATEAMAKASARGLITGWNAENRFGKVYVRIQAFGRWRDLLQFDVNSWGV